MSGSSAKSSKSTPLSEPSLCERTTLKCLDFLYEWNIDGFNNVLERNYEIRSPIFKIDGDNKVKWRLVLVPKLEYPKGRCVSVSLMMISHDKKPSILRYAFSLLGKAGQIHQLDWKEKTFTEHSNCDDSMLLSHAKLIKDGFLSDNCLQIRCEFNMIICDYSDDDGNCDSGASCEILNILSSEESSVTNDLLSENKNSLQLNSLTPSFSKENNGISCHPYNINTENLKTNFESDITVQCSLELLSDDLRALYVTKNFTDATIVAENIKFRVHKAIICSRSDFFKNICADRKENVIVFDDIKSEVMENVLFYLYSGVIRQTSVELGLDLLHSAKKFRLFHFQQLVIEALKKNITVENVTDILRHSEDLKLRELKNACLQFIVSNYSEVVETDKWKRMLKINPNIASEVLISKSTTLKRNYF